MTKVDPYKNPYSVDPDGEVARRMVVKIGEVDVSAAVTNSQFSNGLNKEPLATIELRSSHPAVLQADWKSTVTAFRAYPDPLSPIFTGDVTSVKITTTRVEIKCSGVVAFKYTKAGGISCSANARTDLLYAMARGSGLEADRVRIENELLVHEVFEILIPVSGVSSADSFQLGNTKFIIPEQCRPLVASIDPNPLLDSFLSAELYSVTYKSAEWMYDAEQQGISEARTWLNWLLVRSRYSFATLPGRNLPEWIIDNYTARPDFGTLVFVRGLLTGRRWLRDTRVERNSGSLQVDNERLMLKLPEVPDSMSERLRLALLSSARAITDPDPAVRITSLWDALEFYAGETQVRTLFSKSELKKLNHSIPKEFSNEKKQRIRDVQGRANDAPLMAKIRTQLAKDGVPVTTDEFDNLVALRRSRNNLVHGKVESSRGFAAKVDDGIALVSRILLHALSAQERKRLL